MSLCATIWVLLVGGGAGSVSSIFGGTEYATGLGGTENTEEGGVGSLLLLYSIIEKTES